MLCLGILMAAYRQNLPHSPNATWAAAFSPLFAAFWPFQLKRVLQSPAERLRQNIKGLAVGSVVVPTQQTHRTTIIFAPAPECCTPGSLCPHFSSAIL